jgi:hypothetical protein
VVVVIAGGWAILQTLGSDTGGGGSSSSSAGSAGDAPPAPASDDLRDGPWLLERYRLNNTASGLTITGTVRNTGDATASADLTTWVYQGQESLGSVSATVTDVPAGAAVEVEMTGDAVFKSGDKNVLLQAS